ncbi:3371_t:CDS:2 [Funneliformis caledonium]|uniref:3371_t:CDS:1 n=1 Tax=Funneliformis caledonium TaxID=1117310 RepID=A0A9N9ARP2_9GLOM|nr:3371_t:CDS:2 [Funneliformis caledonium]
MSSHQKIDESDKSEILNPQEFKTAVTYDQVEPSNVTHSKSALQLDDQSHLNGQTNSTAKLQSWKTTLEKAINAIVSIKANCVRDFDTQYSGEYCGTGFVVDKERGIILSNRHIVSPAPIVAQATFINYEEVELKSIYRDPIHDFGFLKFDPSKIKFMDLVQIPLEPERAKVGIEIRVAGNDSGEKAPEYGIGYYNDFNTFYFQAASGTSGGSSGSPVLDIEGNAVALNAGCKVKASSSFYLPLDRAKRALKYIQEGKHVPRGTLQTEFEYTSYDELRRLGLGSSIEKEVREKFPDETGLLVVRKVLPKGPADGLLIPGDIIIRANKDMIANFIHLFSIIDDSIGEDIELTICRGKDQMDIKLKIQDLHSITPNRFVEVGGGIVHELSYQLAYSYSQPVEGPYIASSGFMFGNASAWSYNVIDSVNNIPTPNLDAFIEIMKDLPDGARVSLRFHEISNIHKEKVAIMYVDRYWNKFRIGVRDDNTGLWNYEEIPPPKTIYSYKPDTARVPILNESLHPSGKVWPSFVKIECYLPYLIDGITYSRTILNPFGVGVVMSTEPPLIVCDRDAIPISIGNIFITFANSIIIPGKLLYLHPMYNYAFITYDKTLLEDTLVKAIEISDKDLEQGDPVYLVGFCEDYLPEVKKTIVSKIINVRVTERNPPRWRAINVEGITVDGPITQGGVLCDDDGKVQGLWLTYSAQENNFICGLQISLVKPTLELLKRGELPKLRGLNVEFCTMKIVKAKFLGLSGEWIRKFESIPNSKNSCLYILNILDTTSPAGELLKVGDIILTINGNIVTRMRDLPAAFHYSEELIFRDGKEINVKVGTTSYGKETTRIIGWSGALIQAPYKAALEQVRKVPTGVYVSGKMYGSPADASLRSGVWIVEIQGRKVSDLDSFLKAIDAYEQEMKEKADENDGYVRIKTIDRTNVTNVITMKLDPHYWSTWQLVEDEESTKGWKYVED